MTILKRSLFLILSLALCAGPVAALGSGGPLSSVTTMTICSEGGTKTIHVDQNGEPVLAVHICMDCSLTIAQVASETGLVASFAPRNLDRFAQISPRSSAKSFFLTAWSRGPPL